MASTLTFRMIFLLSIWVVCLVLYFGSKKLSLSLTPVSHTHNDNPLVTGIISDITKRLDPMRGESDLNTEGPSKEKQTLHVLLHNESSGQDGTLGHEAPMIGNVENDQLDSTKSENNKADNPSESTKTEIDKAADNPPDSIRTENNKTDNPSDTLQADNSSAISEFRQRYLSWYEGQFANRTKPGPDKVTNSSRYLIYRCDNGRMSFCGGWADRVKGMMAAYLMANLTGRVFKLEVKSPACQLTDYVVPNLVNWSLPHSIHPTLNRDTPHTRTINMVDKYDFYINVHKTNFHTLIGDEDYIYFKANLDYSLGFRATTVYKQELSWMKNLTNAQILGGVYTRLFKLSPPLFSRLQDFLARTLPTPKHRLICAQLRVGKNPNIPNDSETRLDTESLSKVWTFFKNHSKSDLEPIFIMTDSDEVLNAAKNQSFGSRIISTPGRVMHVDKSNREKTEDVCNSLGKVIFDQHILMNCDVLMISKSGLGRLAAYVRDNAKGLYCLYKNGHKLDPCGPGDIKSVFKIIG